MKVFTAILLLLAALTPNIGVDARVVTLDDRTTSKPSCPCGSVAEGAKLIKQYNLQPICSAILSKLEKTVTATVAGPKSTVTQTTTNTGTVSATTSTTQTVQVTVTSTAGVTATTGTVTVTFIESPIFTASSISVETDTETDTTVTTTTLTVTSTETDTITSTSTVPIMFAPGRRDLLSPTLPKGSTSMPALAARSLETAVADRSLEERTNWGLPAKWVYCADTIILSSCESALGRPVGQATYTTTKTTPGQTSTTTNTVTGTTTTTSTVTATTTNTQTVTSTSTLGVDATATMTMTNPVIVTIPVVSSTTVTVIATSTETDTETSVTRTTVTSTATETQSFCGSGQAFKFLLSGGQYTGQYVQISNDQITTSDSLVATSTYDKSSASTFILQANCVLKTTNGLTAFTDYDSKPAYIYFEGGQPSFPFVKCKVNLVGAITCSGYHGNVLQFSAETTAQGFDPSQVYFSIGSGQGTVVTAQAVMP